VPSTFDAFRCAILDMPIRNHAMLNNMLLIEHDSIFNDSVPVLHHG
jgi:hypothetical protein